VAGACAAVGSGYRRRMPDHPLAALLDLPDVAPALDKARTAVDQALRHRALRRSGGPIAAEVGLRSAVASAALEGHLYDLESVRDGVVTDPVVQGALRATAALDGLAPTWTRAPRQVLAKLHTLIARDAVPFDALGRPRKSGPRLDTLMALLSNGTGEATLLLAAVVHGELLALKAFEGPGGVLARAAARLTLIAGGLDPRGLLAVDVGHQQRQPEYVGAAGAFATGTPDGLRSWLRHYATAVEIAADDLTALADTTA
jgi:hypothetical protein